MGPYHPIGKIEFELVLNLSLLVSSCYIFPDLILFSSTLQNSIRLVPICLEIYLSSMISTLR